MIVNMPSFTSSSDDEHGPQISCKLSTHVALTKAGDVAAARCKRQPPHHECRDASANLYAEKVDDNFQSSESTESRQLVGRKESDIAGSRVLMIEEDVVEMTSGSLWEDGVPINNTQISDQRQSGASLIALALVKETDPLHKWSKGTCNDISYTVDEHLHEELHGKDGDREDEEEACLTPRAKQHRIPSEILICPPPPCKKRRSTPPSLCDCFKLRKRLSYAMATTSSASSSANSASSAQYMHRHRQYAAAACQVVVNPPDLQAFPACIRALFFHD